MGQRATYGLVVVEKVVIAVKPHAAGFVSHGCLSMCLVASVITV